MDYTHRSSAMQDRQAERGRMRGRPLARTIRPNVHGPLDRKVTDEGTVSKEDTLQKDTPPTAPPTPDASLPVSFSNQIIHRISKLMGHRMSHPATTPITVINTSDSIFMEYMSSRSDET
jgi:hypothetical protein